MQGLILNREGNDLPKSLHLVEPREVEQNRETRKQIHTFIEGREYRKALGNVSLVLPTRVDEPVNFGFSTRLMKVGVKVLNSETLIQIGIGHCMDAFEGPKVEAII